MGRKEKRFLGIFIIICFLLPLGMIASPLEIISHVVPLWGFYYGFVAYWGYTGKPIWQAFLASYGIASLGIILVYFGMNVAQIVFVKLRSVFVKHQKKNAAGEKRNNKTKRIARWMGKGNAGLILFVLLVPFPWSDPIATMAMKLKGTKHGLWLLLAVNIPHVYIIVWGAYKGVVFFPTIIEFFKRLFM